MKKKIFFGIVMLFVLSIFVIKVNANTYYPIGEDLPAKAPAVIPANGATVKATVTEGFDLSDISFPKSSGSASAPGKSELRKIIIGTLKNSAISGIGSGVPSGWSTDTTKTSADYVNLLFDNWFTAYCLDSSSNYPEYGIFSYDNYLSGGSNTSKAAIILDAALYNDSSVKAIFDDVEAKFNGELYAFLPYYSIAQSGITKGTTDETATLDNSYYYSSTLEKVGDKVKLGGTPTTGISAGKYTCLSTTADATCNVAYRVGEGSGTSYTVSPYYVFRGELDSTAASSIVTAYEAGNEVSFEISGLEFFNLSYTKSYYYVASDAVATALYVDEDQKNYLTSDHTIDYITVKTDIKKTAFLDYKAIDTKNITNYEQALWIVEHSYPTLTIDQALSLPKGDYAIDKTKLDTQLISLYGITGTDAEKAAQLAVVKENVVYGITQYAIWAAVGNKVKDEATSTMYTLGKTMDFKVGTELFELDKLYNYYLLSRDEYSGYSDSKVFDNGITISRPSKEYAGETTDGFLYGPYKANYNAVLEADNPGKIQIEITNTDKTNIKFLGSDKKTDITTTGINKGEEFYIQVGKKANIGNVTFKLSLAGVQTFSPATNRGRVYYAVNSPSSLQNAMSGGKITSTTINGEFSVITNAKTGVENVAMLLMVTLVAFTLGYFVLSYKNKPIQLS